MSEETEYVDSETLISEVKSRPALYTRNGEQNADKGVKEKLWWEVCEAIIPNWAQLSNERKLRAGREIQRKWKNIRDCFRKELNLQRKYRNGQAKKKRQYIFYEQLLFLLPEMREKRATYYDSPQSSNEETDENMDIPGTSTEPRDVHALWGRKSRKNYTQSTNEPYFSSRPYKQDKEPEMINEDKYFLYSLLPSFKTLSPDQKLQAKIEFLQTLRKLTSPSPAPSLTEQLCSTYDVEDDDNVPMPKQEAEDF